MKQSKQFQINISTGDFSPLLRSPEYLFRGLKGTGVHGIELWVGVKSRWTINRYKQLSEKYNLPIVSLHQPLWAMTGMYFDEGFFTLAQKLGVQHITCHPLPGIPLQDLRMQNYFKHLAAIQKRIGIPILIENLPQTYRNGLLHHLFPPMSDASDVLQLHKTVVTKFGLGMTLDTDHVHVPEPHKQPWFDTVLPKVDNIHLSSFGSGRHHLPPYMGDLRATEFIHYLQEQNYIGSITLEIGWPKSITMRNYDFDTIKKSIESLQK